MKKIIVTMMLLLPLCMVAQELKIAIVNTQEVVNVMPEASAMETEMANLKKQYDNQLKLLTDEHTKKYSDLMAQQDSLTENIQKMRLQDIQNLELRIENFQQMASQELEKKYGELLKPIQEKLQKAIDQVGEENGYAGILDPRAFHYVGKAIIDATDKVKAKLGLK